tara:strand:+ start:1974 stop:2570 length:597 start_codon:yes stop_codon:yes gene_type:complete
MSLAVFILPEEPFTSELVLWKNKIRKDFPKQPYADHPPHLTLINLNSIDETEAIKKLSSFSEKLDSIKVEVNSRNVFLNDVFTGGHTIYFGLKKSNSLMKLQILIADALAPIKKNTNLSNNFKKDSLLYRSNKNYGFPYVGDHWIPHFTVASLTTNKRKNILKNFLSIPASFDFEINRFSIWRIHEDVHIKLKTIKII